MDKFIIDKKFNLIKDNNFKLNNTTSDYYNNPIAKYFNIGYYLSTPLLLGVFFGLYLDKKFNTNGLIVLILIFLGFICSLFNLYKLTKKKDNKI